MDYNMAKKYLDEGFIVKNDEFEYKRKYGELYCREPGTEMWKSVYKIGNYEKQMNWEILRSDSVVKPNNTIPKGCIECLKYKPEASPPCDVFTIMEEGCKGRITNKLQYLRELHDMIKINKLTNNTKFFRDLQKEYERMYTSYQIEITSQIYRAFIEDTHRGTGGGSSEGTSRRNIKQIMKDNRIDKPDRKDREAYNKAVKQWEEEQGVKLDKHRSMGYGMTHKNQDEYVNRPIDKDGILPTEAEIEKALEKLIKSHCLTEEDVLNGLSTVTKIKD